MALNVLVVDDSATMRKMVRRVLKMTGLVVGEVNEVDNGERALDELERQPYDLMLLDVNMPQLDGMSCLSLMRGSPSFRALPTVMVTSEASVERRERMRELGATYVKKPFTAEKLATAVINALGGTYGLEQTAVEHDGPDF